MFDHTGSKIALGGLLLYIGIALYCIIGGDYQHAWMFLAGGCLWGLSILIFNLPKKDE